MPPTASDAIPNTRPRCTGVAARFHAGSLAVCREGSVVALHFGTPDGSVIVTMRERDFVRGARGPVDHHGHPFRTLEQLDAENQQDASAPAASAPSLPDRAEKLRQAWSAYQSGQAWTMRDAAAAGGVRYDEFSEFVRFHHRDEATRIRRERWKTKHPHRLSS